MNLDFCKGNYDDIDDYPYGSEEYYEALSQRLSLLKRGQKMNLNICQGNYNDIIVPKRFSDRIFIHVASHYLPPNNFAFRPPLYLVIEGTPGEGKTVQTIASCKKKGIEIIYISGSQLSGKNEGDSKQILDEYYHKAIDLVECGNYLAIIIDDFHLSNAISDENIKRTINSNILINYMMNLSAISPIKIPIILTGNDFSKIYAPLIRDGRADVFYWQPTEEEKITIVQQILAPFILASDHKNLNSFIIKNLNESIAFFSQLKHDLRLSIMLELIDDIPFLDQRTVKKLDSEIKNRLYQITTDQLEELAYQRLNSRMR